MVNLKATHNRSSRHNHISAVRPEHARVSNLAAVKCVLKKETQKLYACESQVLLSESGRVRSYTRWCVAECVVEGNPGT
jgi:hypothetical protein